MSLYVAGGLHTSLSVPGVLHMSLSVLGGLQMSLSDSLSLKVDEFSSAEGLSLLTLDEA